MAENQEQLDEHFVTKPVYLLMDEPVGSVEEDILNLRPFADVIAGAALGTKGPFTIGVYAEWGEGKTSVLRLAKELVENSDSKIVTVWFNAWQYGKEDHPIVPLVATIAKSVSEKLSEIDKSNKKLKAGLSKMSMALRAIAYGFSAKGKVSVPGFGELEAGFVAKEMINRYDQLQKGDDPLIEKTLYYNAFEMLETLAKQATEDIETPKIAVFIDDLDRCNPPEAIKLLESIKLVLSQKGFVFTLALDKRVLQGFLKHRYEEEFKVKDYETGGKDYLDKIIQLPLPLLSHEKRFPGYIEKLLGTNTALNDPSNQPIKTVISDLKDVLAKGSQSNPRNLVRFLNNLIVDRLLWKMVDSGKEADAEVMGFCVISRILRDHFKDERLYKYLWRSQTVCDAIQSFVLKEKPASPEELSARDKKGIESDGRSAKAEQIIAKLKEMEFLQDVLRTPQGRDWLGNKDDMRVTVNQFIVEQRKEDEPVKEFQDDEPVEEFKDDEKILDDVIRKEINMPEVAISDGLYVDILRLNLADKGLKILPSKIGKLTGLTELYLWNNQLTDLPEAIGKLTNLTELNLNYNQLTDLPEAIGELTNLTTLYLYDNKLTALPEAIGELTNLTTLYLWNNKLTALPEAIGELANLTELYLGGNQLTALPELIGKLTNLTGLYLHDNQLTDLPEAIGKLANLTELNINGNQLTDLPEAIGKLANLTELNINGNQLTALPELIGKLTNLTGLYLHDNQLTDLPEAIGKLANLTELNINGNQLTALPEAISKLAKLTTLYLNGNQLIKEDVEKVRRLLPNCDVIFQEASE
jgi:Leucine-rich repeat (LRR) protein